MITLFACGDVMLARGIDQILPHPCDPRLHERALDDARDVTDYEGIRSQLAYRGDLGLLYLASSPTKVR